MLLTVDFTTVADYMYYLKACAEAIQEAGPMAVVYLAAAVSDFYIPDVGLAEHKIQSTNGEDGVRDREGDEGVGGGGVCVCGGGDERVCASE